ncbi:hypothetical protein CLAFUW4_02480 [Fulvia fulva]|uniref:Uncharacterized protein n=1 Tax=Passalora fulva TaxID=5499 RepID=A0A9Q8P576_PASFU|nr:uncharacterized protein CLAFUR5_02470 [Fulvia fulva]KAK4632120.1 hypothetical protein CLAFUR4_02475 [Fulvia fulva]KAK4633302.1 hypothetical protein CLAFUR0_02479 [Fulvia fulva]UJO13606.1 hypothetical protein CLAFUR5_02470 [Fulvia fulva]WPV10816.1 hypothetical protein CLAFUW4_02480 [Fulvia fulva]WPV26605.1 hypothetical protein CLAFUW7_02480 [Fulvia fulva]
MAFGAFANFDPWRHTPPLLLASMIVFNGWYFPFVVGPARSLLKFGFTPCIAKSREAGVLNMIQSARVTTIGLAVWGCYLVGQYKAVDIVLASMGYVAVVDAYVMSKEGADGSVAFRGISTGLVAAWGLFGMTTGTSIFS